MELQELERQRDVYVHNLFWLGLKIALIFIIPAVGAALLGKHLDTVYRDGEKLWTIILLVFTFIFSWVITLWQFSKINKKIQDIESKIRELKQTQNNA